MCNDNIIVLLMIMKYYVMIMKVMCINDNINIINISK